MWENTINKNTHEDAGLRLKKIIKLAQKPFALLKINLY